jgi:Cu-Zn family superoxide dismutase
MSRTIFAVSAVAGLALVGLTVSLSGQDADQHHLQKEVDLPTHGVAVLSPTEGSDVRGVILFQQENDVLRVVGKVVGLEPGRHGFHIHEFGDLRDAQGESAGGHFNPTGAQHGGPQDQAHHAGDFGNIEADESGAATINMEVPWLELHYVVGRSIVVHEGEDDLKSQPSGDAGGRAALGVIGIAQPPEQRQVNRPPAR